MFGRATITLGIGPHFSQTYFLFHTRNLLNFGQDTRLSNMQMS